MSALLESVSLVKDFGGFRAVDGVDLTVSAGEIRSVIGPNGAGKTTLFNLIGGSLRPSAGTLRFAGTDITRYSPHRVARLGIARSFQTTSVFPRLTVIDSLATAVLARRRRTLDFFSWRHLAAREDAMEIADSVDLAAVAEVEARALSHGDQRRLDLALAIATKPRLLMLDEPTSGMSPWETERTVELIRTLARANALTVLLSEHDMQVVFALSDRIAVMHQGAIIADGSPDEVAADARVTEVYLGSETE